jgi:hypothetical protein
MDTQDVHLINSHKIMKKIGIITIHRIYNYGSVLQAFALQTKIENLGCKVEIIDYVFPNAYHKRLALRQLPKSVKREFPSLKRSLIKLLYIGALYNQHRKIHSFLYRYLNLSSITYSSLDDLVSNPPIYDVYVTGSDQVWNPCYCYGDKAFFLNFVPGDKSKIAYSSSFGVADVEKNYYNSFASLLEKYDYLSVREKSGKLLVERMINRNVDVVLDPTLLLTNLEWNLIATSKRLIKTRYILCYYLNYSFNAFPYVDNLAQHIQGLTNYKIVCVARPPQRLHLANTEFLVGASPEDFLSLVRDAELVLTTSFHGTAFAVNYSKPLFSVVEDQNSLDSRQMDLLREIGLESRILSIKDRFPTKEELMCDYSIAEMRLSQLREKSLCYLSNSINNE